MNLKNNHLLKTVELDQKKKVRILMFTIIYLKKKKKKEKHQENLFNTCIQKNLMI